MFLEDNVCLKTVNKTTTALLRTINAAFGIKLQSHESGTKAKVKISSP